MLAVENGVVREGFGEEFGEGTVVPVVVGLVVASDELVAVASDALVVDDECKFNTVCENVIIIKLFLFKFFQG